MENRNLFRISKTDLRIRPVYHRLRERIEAHICISFVSYLLYKELERIINNLEPEISINKAIKAVNKMYEIVVHKPNTKSQIIRLKNNELQQKVLDLVNAHF